MRRTKNEEESESKDLPLPVASRSYHDTTVLADSLSRQSFVYVYVQGILLFVVRICCLVFSQMLNTRKPPEHSGCELYDKIGKSTQIRANSSPRETVDANLRANCG
jgi:hypothetical protein